MIEPQDYTRWTSTEVRMHGGDPAHRAPPDLDPARDKFCDLVEGTHGAARLVAAVFAFFIGIAVWLALGVM